MKSIYEYILNLDKTIKDQKLFYHSDHKNGKFQFQLLNKGEYTPYFCDFNKSIDKNKKISYPGANYFYVYINEIKYHLLDSYQVDGTLCEKFLNTGFFMGGGFLSENGDLYFSLHSKNLPPQIFSTHLNLPSRQGKNPFVLTNDLENHSPIAIDFDSFNKIRLHLIFKEEANKKIDLFWNKNLNIKNGIELNLTQNFNLDDYINVFKKLSSYFIDDTDKIIFDRADLVYYLISNQDQLNNNIKNLSTQQKKDLTIFFETNAYIDLLPDAVNLQLNKFYSQFPVDPIFDDDYGARKIKNIISFLRINSTLEINNNIIKKTNKI